MPEETFAAEGFQAARERMVEDQLRRRGIRDERVLDAMLRVPRHEFINAELARLAYDDSPVPIGGGQTISQPFIVAYMLQLLAIDPNDRVLEIGTGTGYQAAVLSLLATEVFTMEVRPELAARARINLARTGFTNAVVIDGDGSEGLPSHAPFDCIIVAAAVPAIPTALAGQLQEGGSMIAPVGSVELQMLQLARKSKGSIETATLDGCRFVPLIGEAGFPAWHQ